VDERVIMAGTVPCTLEPRNQRLTNIDVTSKSGLGYQHNKSRLMSAAGREIVGPGYAAAHIYGEAWSRMQADGNVR
jgi:hypothetical protein